MSFRIYFSFLVFIFAGKILSAEPNELESLLKEVKNSVAENKLAQQDLDRAIALSAKIVELQMLGRKAEEIEVINTLCTLLEKIEIYNKKTAAIFYCQASFILVNLGEFEKSEVYARRSREILQDLGTDGLREMDLANYSLMSVLVRKNLIHEKALIIQLTEESIDLAKKYYGENHSRAGVALARAGEVYSFFDRNKAKLVLKEATEILEKNSSPNLPLILPNVYYSLGNVILESSPIEAEKYFRASTEKIETIEGQASNPFLISIQSALITSLCIQKRFEEIPPIISKIKSNKAMLNQASPTALHKLAYAESLYFLNVQKFDEAIKPLENLRLQMKLMNPPSPDGLAIQCLNQLGLKYFKDGRSSEAASVFSETISYIRRRGEIETDVGIQALVNYSETLGTLHKVDDAKKIWAEVRSIFEKRFGAQSEKVKMIDAGYEKFLQKYSQ